MKNACFRIRPVLFGALTLFAVQLSGCTGGPNANERTLVVSIEPQRALLEEITGDKFDIVTMLTPGANPETFEPGMSARGQLENSRLYFTTGFLPFENALSNAAGNKVKVVNISNGIQPVYGTHEHHHDGEGHHEHHHGEGADPHVWTSVKNAKVMAANMLEAVVELDPENSEYYTERHNRLQERLDSLDNAYTRAFADIDGEISFAIWHPSLSYLARDYGLNQIAVGYETKEMPAATLRRVIDDAKAHDVKVLFFQKEFDSRQAETLNAELGTELITINPLDYDWQRQLDNIVSALCR